MFIRRLWNTLSIREKIWGLVLLPTLVIIGLTSRQFFLVNDEMLSLNKAEHVVTIIDDLKRLNKASTINVESSEHSSSEHALSQLQRNTTTIFSPIERSQFEQLTSEYAETIEAIASSEGLEDKIDSIQWQVDVHKQLLLNLEKTKFKVTIPSVDSHLRALFQLEWLMLWVNEENRKSTQLINTYSKNSNLADMIQNDIRALTQSQQLYVERFVAINADQKQVSLMLAAFSNIAFEQSNEYRQQLLDKTQLTTLTDQKISLGEKALIERLTAFEKVTYAIEDQLKHEISLAIKAVEKRKVLFLGVTLASILLVLLFGIALAHRITSNLGLVLHFLKDDTSNEASLTSQVEGRDELTQFAVEVERLTLERKKNQTELVLTKNEAIKAKEEAIQASKAKSSFLANMSHEIRTPLNGVIGVSEILSSTQLDATQKDYVDTIETSSQLLLSLINDILDFSKIESGKLQVTNTPTSVRESIYDVASIVSSKLKDKGIALNVNIASSLPYSLMVDDHRLRQVLMNLMSNAAKFTEEGSVSIGVTHVKQDGQHTCVFEVTDTGIGICDEQQKKIFEPFSQEDDSITRQFGGTGLGLAISTQLIEMMGGQLQIVSEKNNGSRFYFPLTLDVAEHKLPEHNLSESTNIIIVSNSSEITEALQDDLQNYRIKVSTVKSKLSEVPTQPIQGNQVVIYVLDNTLFDVTTLEEYNRNRSAICLVQPFNADAVEFGSNISALITYPLLGKQLIKALERCCNATRSAQNCTPIQQNNDLPPSKVLLVDDNKINQKVASVHLTKLGCEYDIANNGQEAIEMYSTHDYNLVLMDCMMPVKNGFIASKEIREYEVQHNKAHATIIALTASISDDVIKKLSDFGMDDYLQKPFETEVFQKKVLGSHKPAHPQVSDLVNKIEEIKPSQVNEKQPTPPSRPKLEASNELRVLLVEDNKINQKVATIIFKKAGYDYVIANNGQEAIDIYSEDQKFDIVLMDLMMPVKDGFEATKDIRAYEKSNSLSPIPIIAVTASVVNDDITQCFYAGMNAYIPKPIQPEKLYREINNLMSIESA